MKYIWKILLHVFCLIVDLAFGLYLTTNYIRNFFGKVSLQQILFNIRTSNSNPDIVWHYTILAIPYILIFVVVTFILLYLTIKLSSHNQATISQIISRFLVHIRNIFSYLNKKPLLIFVLVLAVSLIVTVRTANRRLKISDYLSMQDNPFIENNFALLDINSAKFLNKEKKNLILIFVESLEKGYSDKSVYGTNLLEPLLKATRKGISLSGYVKTPGSYFTLDGISAQTLGMPVIQFPIDIHDTNKNNEFGVILGAAPGIFNLLQKSGYATASFSGTSRYFTHKGDFLKVHGITKSFFKEDWIDMGFHLTKENMGRWDFNDVFLMQRFKEFISKNVNNQVKEPFAFIFETVDTHFPDGWAPNEYKIWKDNRDSFIYASNLIADFITWAKKQSWYKNTVIVIVGDHPWQDFSGPFTNFTKKSNNREIFTAVLNSGLKTNLSRNCGFTAMDIAPTILNLMGIDFKSKLKK
jgi:hypothetical protein